MNEISPRIPLVERLNETLATRFARFAATTPDSLAVCAAGESLTYGELDHLSGRMASALQPLTPDPERPIALMMREGPLLIAAMLAATKINRIFIPLETRMPEDWLAGIVADSGTACILHDAPSRLIAERAARPDAPAFDASALAEMPATAHLEPLDVSSEAPAYIVYTSGTTGKPKGVIISHRTIMYGPDVRGALLHIDGKDRIANIRSSGTSSGMSNNFQPLMLGACLVQFDLRKEGLQRLGPWLNENNVTGISFSGSLLRTWIAALPEEFRFTTLRFLIATAEPLYAGDVKTLARHFPADWRVMHTLASSETSVVAAHVVGPTSPPEADIVPVGHPVDGTEIRVEDEDGNPVPPGERGEIVVRSPHLALGYWNDPATTAKAFSVAPDGVRVYHSGDLGRWRDDGKLEHLGRKDRRIKLQGYSVEPVEVERGLLRLPGVCDAIVMVDKSAADELRLIAYVVSRGDRSLAAGQAMRSELSKLLPQHFVPAEIILIDSLPLTASGKVDRAALPKPQEQNPERASYREPSGGIEKTLASIWEDVLKIPRISADADFYEIGGTSLQAFLIFARIATTLGSDLPPTRMLDAPSIVKQADLLRQDFRSAAAEKLVPFRAKGSNAPLFIVHGAFGDIMFVREIARDLKSDRPVYGLQPPPLDGAHPVPRRIERIAADYLAEIRKVQPNGPYLLAGYSFGGSVALEMAQQLTRAGEPVAFLGLIDTSFDARQEVAGEQTVQRISRHMHHISGRNLLPYLSQRLRKTLKHRAATSREALQHLPYELCLLLGRPVPYEERAPFYRRVYFSATRRYIRRPYDGPVVMFARQGQSEWHQQRWAPIAKGGLAVHEIPAGHTEMVWPPHSVMLAERLDDCLARIGERQSDPTVTIG